MFYMGFLGGLSENNWKIQHERDHQFTRRFTRMRCRVKKIVPPSQGVPGTNSDQSSIQLIVLTLGNAI